MMRFLLVSAMLVASHPVMAAYQNPTVISHQILEGGALRLTMQFTGNAGEPTETRLYTVTPATSLRDIREWAGLVIDELDSYRALSALPALQIGQTITRAAVAAPNLTPKQQWRRAYRKCKALEASGLAGAVATERAACKANLEATYQAGFEEE